MKQSSIQYFVNNPTFNEHEMNMNMNYITPLDRPQNKFYMHSPGIDPLYDNGDRFKSIINRGD